MKPRGLRLLVMHVSTRCDQACAHCSIWKSNGNAGDPLDAHERLSLLGEAKSLGARSVLFTGGEPLLCDHVESLARAAHALGLSVQIATNGLGLDRARSWLGEVVDEVYLSVEGPEAIHDSIRGASMFSRLRAAIAAVRGLTRRPRLIGRSVISSRNAAALDATVAAARDLGLDSISFLSVDALSDAFGGEPAARVPLRPGPVEVAAMREAIARLEAAGRIGPLRSRGRFEARANGGGPCDGRRPSRGACLQCARVVVGRGSGRRLAPVLLSAEGVPGGARRLAFGRP